LIVLRDDAFESHLAGIAFDMLVELDTGERGLADLEWITPQVVAVQFNQVEGVQEHVAVMLAVGDTLERCEPVVIASNRFTIDDAGARAQPGQRIDDQREAPSHATQAGAHSIKNYPRRGG
jgi:hypothetical protein